MDYTYHAVKGVKESFDLAAEASILQYKDSRLFTFEETTEWTEIFNATEGLTGAKELSALETPPVLEEEEGYQVSLSNKRFGGAIIVSEQDREKAGDSTVMIDKFIERQRNDLLTDNRNLFLTNIFTMYNEAFLNTSDYLAPDGVELCGTHVYKSTGTTFVNKATAALDQDAIDDLEEYAGAFVDAQGKPRPLTFDVIVVKRGSDNARMAKKLFAMNIAPTAVGDINIYEGSYTIIETPYITTTNKNYWFALSSREKNPLYVGITKMPSMNEPLREANEAIRSNVTGFWKQGINCLPIGIYGSNGTT